MMRLAKYRIGSIGSPNLLQSYYVPGINSLTGKTMGRPALLIIDMQNDFVLEGKPLKVAGADGNTENPVCAD